MLLGPTMDPRIASELMLRLPHLSLRMKEHSTRALAMARLLSEQLGAQVVQVGGTERRDVCAVYGGVCVECVWGGEAGSRQEPLGSYWAGMGPTTL